jgi:acetolactate synthase-1/2/3 large subunit
MVSSITKFAITITSENDVVDVLEKAWNVMLDGRPGPVWIEIPSNIQRAEIQFEQKALHKEIYRTRSKKDPRRVDFIEKVVKSLVKAKKPLIHFGNGVRISGAQQEMLRLISITNSPFCLTHNSYDLINTSHPLHLGLPGIFGHRFSNFALQNADFYLGIGTRLTLAQTGYRKKDFARNAQTFLVDIDKTELEKEHIRVDFGLVSDAKLFMIDLLEALEHISFDFSRWQGICSDWKQRYSIKNEHANFKINGVSPYDLIAQISQNLDSNSTVITDMGTSYQTTYQGISLPEGARLQTNTGFASMGWGLPAALGATYAATERSVICLTGDGGLMMSVQELAFAAHCKSDFKIFIYNNRGYLTLRQTQIASFGDRVTGVDEHTGLYFPNYKELAESFGIYYILINTSINLKKQVEDLFRIKGPVIIDVVMDIEQPQAPKAANRLDETGKPVQSSLEDLWPFLDVDVLEHEMRHANEKI